MNILDINEASYSLRHASYGGYGGDKDGLVIDGENWIVKYPKSTRGMNVDYKEIQYTTSPLSEYIGSHIYALLGYDVHETMLVYRNGKIAVACKDFRQDDEMLLEVRMIKNAANRELSSLKGIELPVSATGDQVSLEELLLHFNNNHLLSVSGLQERFWDMTVIDLLINNNDRNNGNWGLLRNMKSGDVRLAPVYDNGNSFNNKASAAMLSKNLLDEDGFIEMETGQRTIYEYNGHILSAKKLLQFEDAGLRKAIIRNVPMIKDRMADIRNMIYSIPNNYHGISICGDTRKAYYCRALDVRVQYLLEPAYEKALDSLSMSERLEALKDAAEYRSRAVKEKVGIRNKTLDI